MSDLFPEYEHEEYEPGVFGQHTHIHRDLGLYTGPQPGRGLGHRVIESMLGIDSVLLSTPRQSIHFSPKTGFLHFSFAPASGMSMRPLQNSPLGPAGRLVPIQQ